MSRTKKIRKMNGKWLKRKKNRYTCFCIMVISRTIVSFYLVLTEYFLQKGKTILAIMWLGTGRCLHYQYFVQMADGSSIINKWNFQININIMAEVTGDPASDFVSSNISNVFKSLGLNIALSIFFLLLSSFI